MEAKREKRVIEDEEVLAWARGCEFQCENCDMKILGISQFQEHCSAKHNVDFSKNFYKDKKYKKKYHFCKICQSINQSKNIIWDPAELDKHMQETHKRSIEDYYREYKDKLKKPRFDI